MKPITSKRLLTGIAVLFMATGAAHTQSVVLPEAMLGSWCFILGSNADNPFQLFFSRRPAGKNCSPDVNTLTISKDHQEESVGTCLFDKVQQTAPNAYLVVLIHCNSNNKNWLSVDTGAQRIFELVGEKLMVTWMPEG